MTIKERINRKIQEYKNDFFNETGLVLIAIPKVALPVVSMEVLGTFVCYFYKIEELKGRGGDTVDAKQSFIALAEKMGYSDSNIASFLSLERSTVTTARTSFTSKMRNLPYRYRFYQCLEYIMENVGREDLIQDAQWAERVDSYNIIFSDSDIVTTPQKVFSASEAMKLAKEFSQKKKIKGVSKIIHTYIKENHKATKIEILEFLRSYGIYPLKKDSKTLTALLGHLKKENKVVNVGHTWYIKAA